MKIEPRPRPGAAILSTAAESGVTRYIIEDVYPAVEDGKYPIKRIVGESIDVWVDIFRDGHDVANASLLWRRDGASAWNREPLRLHENDRWTGQFTPTEIGRYVFAIEAWTDTFASWRRDFLIKRKAGQDVGLEIQEAILLLRATRAGGPGVQREIETAVAAAERGDVEALLADELAAAMTEAEERLDVSRSRVYPLLVERPRARCGAWYEFFPRSQGTVPGRHGTFDDSIARLPEIASLGFDVIYLPPIHPIGRVNRKGRNNALKTEPGDPGSPYAIGAETGGHDAVHPELGTLADFRRFVDACAQHGMEVALDFATQCSPDHPWLKQHPQWFRHRPDGSLKYAENPPKKYEDIVNPDFYCADAEALWAAWRDVILFWMEQGVRIFRVDNPHTKPLPFWQWLIEEVQRRDPGVIFLSEAFTRPKMMKALAKIGFTQSYTYFTWRTTKHELSAYMAELTNYPEREYFRPNFFVNTPDILPYHLQGGEPWMFKSRVALAATLASNYGVYSGYELLEHTPIPGREEYLDSEKYEIKVRDWNKPGNIKDHIAMLNRLRRDNPALQQTSDYRALPIDDGEVLGFIKESPAHGNAVAAVISLTGYGPREFWLHFGDTEIGPQSNRKRVAWVEDLRSGERRNIEWGGLRLRMDPWHEPALFFRCHS